MNELPISNIITTNDSIVIDTDGNIVCPSTIQVHNSSLPICMWNISRMKKGFATYNTVDGAVAIATILDGSVPQLSIKHADTLTIRPDLAEKYGIGTSPIARLKLVVEQHPMLSDDNITACIEQYNDWEGDEMYTHTGEFRNPSLDLSKNDPSPVTVTNIKNATKLQAALNFIKDLEVGGVTGITPEIQSSAVSTIETLISACTSIQEWKIKSRN